MNSGTHQQKYLMRAALIRAAQVILVALIPLWTAGPASAQVFQQVLTPSGNNDHASWADYNKDGWVDLYVGDRLFRNNNGTSFSDVGSPVSGDGVWADFNHDGWMDFFSYSANNPTAHFNNQNGTFQAVNYGVVVGTQNSRGASAGDFNGDRYADVYLGGYETDPIAYHPDKILTNNQNETFSVTWTQGNDAVTTPGRPRPARGVATADWDRDGDLDIYVSNYRLEPNALWRNNGSGSFTDVAGTHNARATSPGYSGGHSIGAAWGDFDNDGLLDLFAGNFAHAGQPQSRFLRNAGPAFGYAFADMGTGGVFYQESYASPVTGDIDNDGDLDLYFTTVYPVASGGVANYPILYRNDGNFTFTDVTTQWGLPKTGSISTYQAAFADYNNDGFLDLMTNGILYRNSGGFFHWLKVQLDGGSELGMSPIGAQVVIEVNGKTMVRQIESGTGEGNQNDQTLHFGLGTYTGPVELEIHWPGNEIQYFTVNSVDQLVSIVLPEPSAALLLAPGLLLMLHRRRRAR